MKKHHSQSGFSLVEALVAITILLLVVTGPMKIITQANHSTAYAAEQVNAFFLAQEGLELAEKGRDDVLLQYMLHQINSQQGIVNPMTTFQTTYTRCLNVNGSCGLTIKADGTSVVVKDCALTGGCRLYIDTTSARSAYVHISTASPAVTQTATPYTRTITMTPTGMNGKVKEIKVTSTVTWRTGSFIANQSVTLVTYLENIYDSE